MKENRIITFLLVSALISVGISCKKITTDNVSKLFKVPVLTLKGAKVVSIAVGATYTDPGADYIAEDGTASVIAPSAIGVNAAVPGLYFVDFAKTSESGIYNSEGLRYVAVTSVNNPVDRSGEYLRGATGEIVTIAKVGNGVYLINNPGGAGAGHATNVYMVEIALNDYVVPPQPTDAGEFSLTGITFTATGAAWKVVNAGYGTQLRTFEKL